MFTEKSFIRKYSQELLNKLIEIGHNVIRFSEPRYIVCDKNDVYLTSILPDKDIDEYTDCGINEELFLAIASIRNDKLDYQWFVWDDIEDKGEKFKRYIPGEPWQEWWWFEVHNAYDEEELEARMALVNDEDFRRYVYDDFDICDIPRCNVDLVTMYKNYLGID